MLKALQTKIIATVSRNKIIIRYNISERLPILTKNLKKLKDKPIIHQNTSVTCTTILTRHHRNIHRYHSLEYNSQGIVCKEKLNYHAILMIKHK